MFPLKVDLWVRWSLASYWRFLPAVSLYFFFKPLSFSPSLSQLSAALVFSFLSVNLSLISLHRSVSQLSFRHCLSSLFLSALSALSYSQRPPSATPSVLSFSPKHFFICLLYLALSIHPLHTLFGHLFILPLDVPSLCSIHWCVCVCDELRKNRICLLLRISGTGWRKTVQLQLLHIKMAAG